MTETAITKTETTLATSGHTQVSQVMDVMAQALKDGRSADELEKLLDLHERVSDRQARTNFANAMMAFQAECPPIHKGRTAKIATRGGSGYSFSYAPLDAIVAVVRPLMHKHGLSFTWDTTADANHVEVRCTVSHVDGHSVTSASRMPTASSSGMNEQQKMESAATYGRRNSLSQVLGLITSDTQTPDEPDELISTEQHNEIGELIKESGADTEKLLAWQGVKEIKDITVSNFDEVIEKLKAKLAQKGQV